MAMLWRALYLGEHINIAAIEMHKKVDKTVENKKQMKRKINVVDDGPEEWIRKNNNQSH